MRLIWLSIPDAVLSREEIEETCQNIYQGLTTEECISMYETFVVECPEEPMPRSLKHYCRLTIRKALNFNLELPHGIDKLGLPPALQSFLMLER